MKLESLVIANQNVAVNTFPGLVPVSYTHLDVYKRQLLRQEGFVSIDRRKGAVICLDVDKLRAME